MKIELTIKTDYLPNWGLWEGVRELVQNAKDAETEFGVEAQMNVRYRKDTQTLVIENGGTVLPHEALLLGHTSKSHRDDTIGQFGEGLKLGVLALVRAGHKVKIRSGSEVWVPAIVTSEKFSAEVLAFTIYAGRKDEHRVQVEVSGIHPNEWELFKNRFLFLQQLKRDYVVSTSIGRLLLDPDSIGKVFVKGILVSTLPKLRYGYDLSHADIDRDRKMVDPFDMNWKLQGIWNEVLNDRPDLTGEYATLLREGAEDLKGLDGDYMAARVPQKARQRMVTEFKKEYGENALPVPSLAVSADLEHLGMRGVVVPPALRLVLEAELGTVEANKLKLREQPMKSYSWFELSLDERKNLLAAGHLVNAVEPIELGEIDIHDFRDANFLGFYKDKRVLLAKKILCDRQKTLETLVHEVAHKAGGNDGDKSHVANIERIWSGIVENLR